MTMKRCEADLHFYNDEKHESCPYCQNLKCSIKELTKTEPIKQEDLTVTQGQISTSDNQEELSAAQEQDSLLEPDNVTIGLFKTEKEFSPVVGWLVCTEGTEKGKDYPIKPGINEVGREEGSDVDIVIKGDQSISRRYHAEIEYDPEENIFYLIRKKNQAVKLNELKVRQPEKLKPYDIIQFGKTKFIFAQLCSEKFKWTLD